MTPHYATRACLVAALILAGGLVRPVIAEEPGTLRLVRVPKQAHVYVDGKPVPAGTEDVQLTPGWHELQVEAVDGERILALQRRVEIQAGRVQAVLLPLRPLLAPGKVLPVPGPRGNQGSTGPPSVRLKPLGPNPSAEMLKVPLLGALYHEVLEMQGWANSLRESNMPVYYYYEPDGSLPLGSRGPMGPVGEHGVPLPSETATRLIQDQNGKTLLSRIREVLGLSQIAEDLYQPKHPVPAPAPRVGEQGIQALRISVLTPEIRQRLSTLRAQALKSDAPPPGIPGRRGPTGNTFDESIGRILPPPLRLSDEQVRHLLALITQDESLQRALQQLRLLVDDLALWRAEAHQRQKTVDGPQ